MTPRPTLHLHEEVLLLALRDDAGTIAQGTTISYAMGAAVLAELLLHERIAVDDTKKKIVDCIDPSPVNEPSLDGALIRIRDAKRRAALQTWVTRLANTKGVRERTAEQLCRRGILRADEAKVLLIFTRKIFPEADPTAERELIGRLERAIFTDARDIDPRTVVLLSLANSSNLLKEVFDKKELRQRKTRIEQVVNGEMTGKAARQAIEAMNAAVFAACILPAIMVTTITH